MNIALGAADHRECLLELLLLARQQHSEHKIEYDRED